MLTRGFDFLLGMAIVAALLPVVLLSELGHRLGSTGKRAPGNQPARFPAPAAGEFQFERAIEAYEAVIDAVLAEKRA